MKHLFLSIVLVYSITALSQPGRSAFGFTEIPVSVISAAMGGSQVAGWKGDVNQISDNPAFADSALHSSTSLNYLNYLSTINQASLAYAHLFDSIGLGSAYLRYFDYGTFEEIDESGNDLGKFKAVEYEIGVSLGREYNKQLSYGVTLKQVFSSMYRDFAYGAAVDIGGFYHSTSGNFTAGMTVDNLGMEIIDYTGGDRDFFPMSVNVAITKKFDKAPLLFGVQYNDLQRWDLGSADQDALTKVKVDQLTGEETRNIFTFDNFVRHINATVAFVPSERFMIMLGYNLRRRLELATVERPAMVGFSFGTSIHLKRFGIQYAITSYHLSGASNHFGITTNFDQWYRKKSLK